MPRLRRCSSKFGPCVPAWDPAWDPPRATWGVFSRGAAGVRGCGPWGLLTLMRSVFICESFASWGRLSRAFGGSGAPPDIRGCDDPGGAASRGSPAPLSRSFENSIRIEFAGGRPRRLKYWFEFEGSNSFWNEFERCPTRSGTSSSGAQLVLERVGRQSQCRFNLRLRPGGPGSAACVPLPDLPGRPDLPKSDRRLAP